MAYTADDHIYYNEYVAVLDLINLEFTSGKLPNKQRKLVEAWAEIHKDELMADWNIAQNGELPFLIEPLK
jgi:hypothetical protein